ncbi:Response regulator receiver domain-containing protein [Mariprofundus aestuarium]|uniref:Response regulator receiver domain-containing protein n=1 Tax=Mariprofundus aestuarium TaxID=1921086 RepID=A0A2K8L4M3_MARES|nr:response regulator [Mariprofundus aestuarium]ATX79186.1 Response regulator receiver domain-containing protein [Mariprofundus aestuarium]
MGDGWVDRGAIAGSDQSVADAEAWRGSGTILIIDDEVIIREVAACILEDMGFETMTAENGWEGVQHYLGSRDQIVGVLLDMTMPKMDGIECFSQLRGINPKVKVVLSTGYNERVASGGFAGKGLAGYIQKPYEPKALREKMRSMLEGDSL